RPREALGRGLLVRLRHDTVVPVRRARDPLDPQIVRVDLGSDRRHDAALWLEPGEPLARVPIEDLGRHVSMLDPEGAAFPGPPAIAAARRVGRARPDGLTGHGFPQADGPGGDHQELVGIGAELELPDRAVERYRLLPPRVEVAHQRGLDL